MRFNPQLHPKQIIVVGCGGTGAYAATMIGQMLYDMQTRSLDTPRLMLVDPDVVELKNVGRQAFSIADVGEYKAAVLARRINFMFGLDATYHTADFDRAMVTQKGYGRSSQTILVGAVDNHRGRQELSDAGPSVWLDNGNHFDSGQVIIGSSGHDDYLAPGNWRESEGYCEFLPHAGEWFPDLLKPVSEPIPDISCADLTRQGDQHLLINRMMATITGNYVYKLLHQLPITSYMTVVDLELGIMQPKPITREAIAALAEKIAS